MGFRDNIGGETMGNKGGAHGLQGQHWRRNYGDQRRSTWPSEITLEEKLWGSKEEHMAFRDNTGGETMGNKGVAHCLQRQHWRRNYGEQRSSTLPSETTLEEKLWGSKE